VAVSLLERISARTVDRPVESRSSIDAYISEYLLPPNVFSYGGTVYPFGLQQTLGGQKAKEIVGTLPGYASALRGCPPAFAAQMVRATVLSQARFTFRNRATSSTPRRTFGTRDLGLLERPWPNGTSGELIARMEWHAGLAGTAYVARREDRLRVLRPDWVAILYGSHLEPEDPAHAIDGEIIGFVYCNGGLYAGNRNPVRTLLPNEATYWSPIPDPEAAGVGMSWITPAVRDIQGDRLATDHKVRFFENGATPNLVVKGIPAATKEQFDDIVEAMESRHTGVRNAYKTLYLTAGADATVVGSHLAQIDFKSTQGAGETRISVLSRVPAPILGIAEGLAGSSLNAGNFGQARRAWSDGWILPTLADLCASLAPLVNVPSDAELWFDTTDMAILREDARDAAEIQQVNATTIVNLVNGGFTPESALAAVNGQNMALLKHSGLLSVQLQAPGATQQPALPASAAPLALPGRAGPPDEPEDLDEDELRLVTSAKGAKGAEELHKYWVAGPGLAKWRASPQPWTTLYHHLLKYLPAEEAKRTAAEWFHQVFGFWPGADLNRVTHGKPPRGHKVGPG
jgi:phage portal protein BeeE